MLLESKERNKVREEIHQNSCLSLIWLDQALLRFFRVLLFHFLTADSLCAAVKKISKFPLWGMWSSVLNQCQDYISSITASSVCVIEFQPRKNLLLSMLFYNNNLPLSLIWLHHLHTAAKYIKLTDPALSMLVFCKNEKSEVQHHNGLYCFSQK